MLKQCFLRCRFLQRWVITNHFGIPDFLCNVYIVELVFLMRPLQRPLQSMTKIVLKEPPKESKLIKHVCYILVLAVILTLRQRFLAVTMVNEH